MKKILVLITLGVLIFSCQEKDSKRVLPNSVGAINTLSVVIDNNLWNGKVGDEIRDHFAAPVDGLPWEEPLFTIHQMPPEVFTDFARNSRNILYVAQDSSNVAAIKDDVYARPQKVAFIKGSTAESLIEAIKANSDEIISTFKKHDIKETQNRFKLSLNKENELKNKLGVSLTMPSVYKIVKEDHNFFWIERQIPKGTMNIIVYEMPKDYYPTDSTRVDQIIKMRDSIGKKYVPGRNPETMWMVTEKAYAPYIFDSNINGYEAIETKGMWEVKNFFMAGPFINYIVKDPINDRTLVLEGFTFAPSTDKRDYMFQLESILKTLKIEKKNTI
ncbi:protein of unknown function [Zhouia amylolytica]|uniref:DUF4837 domain-containing protein n=1 Tax=Zhouia amylolytica TaxID=376730 RepID=A0A1I6PS22_9FLAO|nr:DUF4837 family protein [Zhouia amylolytica]SFS42991.1 protein of unknown function [Zhouia amylolytica]